MLAALELKSVKELYNILIPRFRRFIIKTLGKEIVIDKALISEYNVSIAETAVR